MAWVRCCGGSLKDKGIVFPPSNGWYLENGSINPSNVTIDDTKIEMANTQYGEYGIFTKQITPKAVTRTIYVTMYHSQNLQFYPYVNGTAGTAQSFSGSGTITVTITLPANATSFGIRMQTSANGGTTLRITNVYEVS